MKKRIETINFPELRAKSLQRQKRNAPLINKDQRLQQCSNGAQATAGRAAISVLSAANEHSLEPGSALCADDHKGHVQMMCGMLTAFQTAKVVHEPTITSMLNIRIFSNCLLSYSLITGTFQNLLRIFMHLQLLVTLKSIICRNVMEDL